VVLIGQVLGEVDHNATGRDSQTPAFSFNLPDGDVPGQVLRTGALQCLWFGRNA
jgi:hypothetical protein